MIRTRVRQLNPAEPCGGRKPADQVTDRALRYRANSEECKPEGPRQCMWCGGKWARKVEVAHIDGDETNTTPENLAWTCRPCNQRVAANMKKHGAGRRTKQYNPPPAGAKSKDQYAWALSVMRGDQEGDPAAAAQIVLDTPHSKRSKWSRDFWKVRKQKYGPSGRGDGGAVPF